MGLATSFFNERDTDLGETLTKTLLETRQIVPDFLEQHIPEGFTADGQSGDRSALKFEADSDFGEGEENAEAGEAGGWGIEEAAPAAGGWGAAPTVSKISNLDNGSN
jgi:ATP-dependent RNA helicase DDX3X